MSTRQYDFKDGHFHDTWNPGTIDTDNHDDVFGVGGSWPESILELCGCGSPEDVVDAMGEYLTRVEYGWAEPRILQVRDDEKHRLADLLLAYLADDRGLTEHGSSIYGVWLDPAGVRWLELYRASNVGPSEDEMRHQQNDES